MRQCMVKWIPRVFLEGKCWRNFLPSILLLIGFGMAEAQVTVANNYLSVTMAANGDVTVTTIVVDPYIPPKLDIFTGSMTLRVEDDADRIYSALIRANGTAASLGQRRADPVRWELRGTPMMVSQNSVRCFWVVEMPEPAGTDPDYDTNPDDLIIERIVTLIREFVEIRHRIINIDNVGHTIGVRLFLNPRLDPKLSSGPFYVSGVPPIVREREFNAGIGMPEVWLTTLSRTQTAFSLKGIVKGGDATPPDRLVFGEAGHLTADNWDFTVSEFYNLEFQDSAVAYYWLPFTLTPGAKVEFVTYVGLNISTAVSIGGSYGIFVNMPPRLNTVFGDNPLTAEVETSFPMPSPFTIDVTVLNYSDAPLTETTLILQLPPGMSLLQGTAPTQSIGNVPAGSEARVSWDVSVENWVEGYTTINIVGIAFPGKVHNLPIKFVIPAQAQRFFMGGFHMLCLPYPVGDRYPPTALGLSGTLKLARWDPRSNKYRFFPYDIRELRPGEGYWIYLETPTKIVLNGARFLKDTEMPVAVPLYAGWNQVGNPFPQPAYLGGLQFAVPGSPLALSYEDASVEGYIHSFIFFWDNLAKDYAQPKSGNDVLLPPWQAFWVYAKRDVVLLFNEPQFIGSFQVRKRSKMQANYDNLRWKMRISVTVGDECDSHNLLGVANGASDGLDDFDVFEPPRPSPSVKLAFAGGRRGETPTELCYDIKAAGGGRKVWDFVVNCELPNKDVVLQWEGVDIPKNAKVMLVDVDAQRVINMRTASNYRYQSGAIGGLRRFKVVIEESNYAPLKVMQLSVVPVRGGKMAISFVLSKDARIYCAIRTLTGRVVRELGSSGVVKRGQVTMLWDGKDDNGKRVPNGAYIVTVQPVTEDSQTAFASAVFRMR
ncbi:MAG: FlgD immunoglobulin-like domain containing protein [Armatimonadota bacterium]|nr:hypothetical protein [Armatimonadota bacterium]MCX7777731.1 hypothetical protein [Armatimonadota bacterium]MDW8025854.1 FlgD immunoglobulin-like domain containing protein [Armatimonadota bacterium]